MDRGAGESRCIHGAQLPSPVAQRRGLFVVFGDDGGLPFAAGPLDLLVEVIGSIPIGGSERCRSEAHFWASR